MMKRRNIGALLLTFVLALSVCLGGCGRNEEKPEGAYAIYYLKQSGTELSRDYYMVQAAEPENMVTELWEQFIHVPDGEDNVSAFPTNVSLMGTTIEDRVLHFDFSKEYKEMEKEREGAPPGCHCADLYTDSRCGFCGNHRGESASDR